MAEETLNNVNNLENQPSAFDELMAKSDFLNQATVEQPLSPKMNWQDNFVNTTNYIMIILQVYLLTILRLE
jgi:hypothetical protein